jgi:hypothetical protein
MGMRIRILVLTAAGVLAAARLLAAEDASFSKDLMATIALQGMPCDQLIASKRNADSDYTATCKDGNRYHIYVNAQGRVIVQKLTGK